ncbi:DUF1992 domain-containing protein [Propioniciclava tarda]|uniref:DUF1992 domain-containing protein n=1 Tax=Propioniciclava tarda TaxID=433330 RepID=A0A4V2JTF8_PROTD|nr:DUF1992 domain-containing protein [Propioniciclava tarda]TBT96141.1 DUF1992 domain-containing protein [Propioniciclava tarda]SMO32363.1 protein of unknown function [Propioniciclava tarda]HOA89609.1 DUF1992 domain-containing protein [Propioniciclava tarda]HQD61472.1 DUF1992 domain-containing protein [Propioniciclava tarda]
MQFESWIDRQIREAMERGEFDNLPGAGRPLELDDDPEWWIKSKIKRENLEPVLPDALSLRKEVAAVQDQLRGVRTESAARAVLEGLNERIRSFYAAATTRPQIVVRLVDVERELRVWRESRQNS